MLDGATAVFEVGGHVVEAADEFAELFGCALLHAVGVVSGGDGFHGVGECFDGLGDLLREMQREPAGGEESQAGHHQQQEHVEISDLTAFAVENPVGLRMLAQTRHGRGHAEGHRQADDDGVALLEAGGSERVVGLCRERRRAGRCVGRRRESRRRSGSVGASLGRIVWILVADLIRKPGLDLRGGSGALRHLEGRDDAALVVDDGKAVLQGDLVLTQHLVDRFAIQARGGERGSVSGAACRGVDRPVRLLR